MHMKHTPRLIPLFLAATLAFPSACTPAVPDSMPAAGTPEQQESPAIEHGAEVNARDKCSRTPLQSAVLHGSTETCKLLREHGAEE